MGRRPRIVAIVNLTEDSFSDGGRFLAAADAVRHARNLAAAGADWIELGPASSHPDARPVPVREQIARLEPALAALAKDPTPIAVDATEPDVLRHALAAGVGMLNDVRGFPDPALQSDLAGDGPLLVVMHSLAELDRATREHAGPEHVLESIERFFETRLGELVRAGVHEERLIVDPGMGFFLGSDARSSLAVLARLDELRARFGRPVLVSCSRKSFLHAVTGRDLEAIGAASLAAELHAARLGASYLRTHDAAALRDGLAVWEALDLFDGEES